MEVFGPQFEFEDPLEIEKLRNHQPISLGEIRKFVQFFGFPALPMEPGFEEHVSHYWLVDYPAFPYEAEQRKKYDPTRKTLITPNELWANIQAEWADRQVEEKALRSHRNRAGRIWWAFVKTLEETIKERNITVDKIIICPGPDGVVRDCDAEGSFIRFNAPDDSGPIENHRGFYIDLACEEEDPLPFIEAKVVGLDQNKRLYVACEQRPLEDKKHTFNLEVDPEAAIPSRLWFGRFGFGDSNNST